MCINIYVHFYMYVYIYTYIVLNKLFRILNSSNLYLRVCPHIYVGVPAPSVHLSQGPRPGLGCRPLTWRLLTVVLRVS